MRLRKLEHGQSLLFVAPPEVHQDIMDLKQHSENDINGYDVIVWSLHQSCREIERSQPLRISQGLGFYQREENMKTLTNAHPLLEQLDSSAAETDITVTTFREKEEQRLQDLYAPLSMMTNKISNIVDASRNMSSPTVQELVRLWNKMDLSVFEGASMHEEHEREVAQEVEQEMQIQRPGPLEALTPSADARLPSFIRSGSLHECHRNSKSARAVVNTSLASSEALYSLWARLYLSSDFMNTVRRPSSGFFDNYLRPVNYALTSKQEVSPTFLLIVSPHEVSQLLPQMRSSTSQVDLHI